MPKTDQRFRAHHSRRRPKKLRCSECLEMKNQENLNANDYRYICDSCEEESDES